MQGEETSIFGGCILMVSQGTEALWAPPPQMAALEKPARERQWNVIWRVSDRCVDIKIHIVGLAALKQFKLWLLCWAENSMFPITQNTDLLKACCGVSWDTKQNKNGPISPTSRSFSVAVTTTRTRGGNLGCWTALCRYNSGFRTKAASFIVNTDSHLAAVLSIVNWSEILYLWVNNFNL